MKAEHLGMVRKLFMVTLLAIIVSGCSQIAGDHNFTLDTGEIVDGHMFILSNNATLEEGSIVDGPVVMVCCNLDVHGEVNGDVFLLTGNLWVHPSAQVNGDVSVFSGNLME